MKLSNVSTPVTTLVICEGVLYSGGEPPESSETTNITNYSMQGHNMRSITAQEARNYLANYFPIPKTSLTL